MMFVSSYLQLHPFFFLKRTQLHCPFWLENNSTAYVTLSSSLPLTDTGVGSIPWLLSTVLQ